MAKNNTYLIIGGILVLLILLLGLAYMQGSQNNTTTPTATPTAAPSATATVTPTATASATVSSTPVTTATATATVTVTPTATPTATPMVTATPTATPTVMPTSTPTPTPSADPYLAPGWPYYGKQYGPSANHVGTITVHVQTYDDESEEVIAFIMEGTEVGILPGSYGEGEDFIKKKIALMDDVPLPMSWTPIGADGYVYLGEFEYGSYTVYCMYDGFYYQWQTVVLSDSNKNALVTFEILPG